MDSLFYLKTSEPKIVPGKWVIKASTYAMRVKIEDMMADTEISAQKILSDAKAAYIDRFEQGYKDGLSHARREFAEQMVNMSINSTRFLDHIENQVVNTIISAVQKILQKTDDELTIKAMALVAVQSVRDVKQMTIRVCAEQCEQVELIINELRSISNVDWIEVVADENLQHNACILETPFGVVDASLDTQLRNLKDYFKSEFQKERPTE